MNVAGQTRSEHIAGTPFRRHLDSRPTGRLVFAEETLYAAMSSDEDWDDFEWAHRRRFEDKALREPTSTEALQEQESSRRWLNGYLQWGKDTLGFGFYVLRT